MYSCRTHGARVRCNTVCIQHLIRARITQTTHVVPLHARMHARPRAPLRACSTASRWHSMGCPSEFTDTSVMRSSTAPPSASSMTLRLGGFMSTLRRGFRARWRARVYHMRCRTGAGSGPWRARHIASCMPVARELCVVRLACREKENITSCMRDACQCV